MKESLSELYDICNKSIELDGWMKDTGFKNYCKEVSKEAEEVQKALDNEDMDNLKEELGDVLMDLMNACILAEKEGVFDSREVVESVVSKIRRRRPYLEEGRKVSKEESVRLWLEAKRKEKE